MEEGRQSAETPSILAEFATTFRERDAEALMRSVEPRPPSGNHNMSAWGHPCARFQWYNLRKFREREPLGIWSAGQFWIGSELEDPVARRISDRMSGYWRVMDVGWVVEIPPERTRNTGTPLTRRLTGKIDRVARKGPDQKGAALFPIEIKKVDQFLLDKIDESDWRSLLSAPVWMRKYPAQVMGYVCAMQMDPRFADYYDLVPGGVLALCGTNGQMKVVEVPLDADYLAGCYARANTAEMEEEALDQGDAGGRIPYDVKICGRCPYRVTCMPEVKGPDAVFLEADELRAALEEWRDLNERVDDDAVKARDKALEKVKALVRPHGGGSYFTPDGEFAVLVREPVVRKFYDVPEDVKRQYETRRPIAAVVQVEDLGRLKDESTARRAIDFDAEV